MNDFTKQTVRAKDLRDKAILDKIPGGRPGWQRWWAPENALERLLGSRYIDRKHLPVLLPALSKSNWQGEDFFCVYADAAPGQSVRARLNRHVNGTYAVSTLRQSIASLTAGDLYDERTANALIDLLMIEYCPVDHKINSPAAKTALGQILAQELSARVLPLNLTGNNNSVSKDFLTDLKKTRQKSKNYHF